MIYSNLSNIEVKKAVASQFEQHKHIIRSWMQALAYTRNLCAHHARLWNRYFITCPTVLKKDKHLISNKKHFECQAYITIKLLNVLFPDDAWRNRLISLFRKYTNIVPFEEMGFKNNWEDSHLWGL